jgi:vancomycin aglycone glucosyltransferase
VHNIHIAAWEDGSWLGLDDTALLVACGERSLVLVTLAKTSEPTATGSAIVGRMRLLLSTIGSRGDVQPLVALASHLGARRHDVRVCVPPDFREWIESLGIAVTPIGPEVRPAAASRPASTPRISPATPEQVQEMMNAVVASQFETITAAALGCDIIVAATALQVAARSVAEMMGIPYVFAAYSPNVMPSPHHPPPPLPLPPGQTAPATTDNLELWARDAARFNDTFGKALNAHRAALGLAPVDDVRSHMFTDGPWLAADPMLAPWPDPADGVVQTGAWILPDDRPLPPELDRFLESGEPPIYIGFGSNRVSEFAGEVVLQAARAVGRRAIVSRGWFDVSIVEDDEDCLSIGEVNVQALFPRVAAVVHHGGAGSTTAAAIAGAPQVVIPQHYDQHYWAGQVERLGIGMAHAPGAPTAESLTHALEQTLRPDVARRAEAVATAVRRDGVQVAAQRLETLFDRSRDAGLR